MRRPAPHIDVKPARGDAQMHVEARERELRDPTSRGAPHSRDTMLRTHIIINMHVTSMVTI